MSIRVMSEFFGLQLGGANRKMVALRLADFADDSGKGIWPTVARVAQECELSVRTVRRVLEEFVEEGILIVVRKGGGGPGSTTRYDFDLDRVRARAAELAAGKGDSVTPFAKGDSDGVKGDSGDEKGCHGDTRTVIEPSSEPPVERMRAREEGETDPEAKAPGERAFKRAYAAWPTFVSDSEPAARKAWDALTAEERAAAVDREADYIASVKGTGRSKFCTFGVYLTEKRWEKLPPKQLRPADLNAPPFGKLWQAARFKQLVTGVKAPIPAPTLHQRTAIESGLLDEASLRLERHARYGWPQVNAMHERARMTGQGVTVAAQLEPLGELMEAVQVGSDLWLAWQAAHERRGWPWLPDPGRLEWVWFPAGGPDGLAQFERAVRGNEHDGRPQAAE